MTAIAETGITTGKFIRRGIDGSFWSTGLTAFEAYNSSNIALYGISGTETGVTGIYTATDPSNLSEGDFIFVKAAGSSLVVSDLTNGIRWQNPVGPKSASVVIMANGVITAASIADGAITESKILLPDEVSGRPTTILGMIRRTFQWISNKRIRDRSSGAVSLRNDDDSNTLENQTQSTSGTIDIQSGGVP